MRLHRIPENCLSFPCSEKSLNIPGLWPPGINTNRNNKCIVITYENLNVIISFPLMNKSYNMLLSFSKDVTTTFELNIIVNCSSQMGHQSFHITHCQQQQQPESTGQHITFAIQTNVADTHTASQTDAKRYNTFCAR